MTKLDPDHPIIRYMLIVIFIYFIVSYILNNIIQSDYNYSEMENIILNAEKQEDLIEPIKEINKIAKIRFIVLIIAFSLLFVLYLYYKIQTDKSESTAIIFAICLSLSGKIIEKLGLDNCLTIPVINPKGSPSNVLLFDMFYTNFFAYFLDFIYAFAAVMILSKNESIFKLFKNSKFLDLVSKNLSLYTNGKIKFINIIRFLVYLFAIVIFWNWGSIIRPKVTLLIHRYLGIPVIDKGSLKLKDENNKEIEKESGLVTTIPSIGILSAATVEGLIFTGLLFPMRKFFLYNLNNKKEYNDNKISIIIKFIALVFVVPVCMILLTKYTLSSHIPSEYRIQKMISIVLLGYILIPIIMLMIQSILKIKILDFSKKYKTISITLFILIPIITGIILDITKKNSISYISDEPHLEKIKEKYMSESKTSECDESQTKYKYLISVITICMTIFAFGPMINIHKLQPLTAILYLFLIFMITKIVYSFQNNFEPYNILNPMRKDYNSDIVDLDSVTSIQVSIISIFITVSLLLIFRKINQNN